MCDVSVHFECADSSAERSPASLKPPRLLSLGVHPTPAPDAAALVLAPVETAETAETVETVVAVAVAVAAVAFPGWRRTPCLRYHRIHCLHSQEWTRPEWGLRALCPALRDRWSESGATTLHARNSRRGTDSDAKTRGEAGPNSTNGPHASIRR